MPLMCLLIFCMLGSALVTGAGASAGQRHISIDGPQTSVAFGHDGDRPNLTIRWGIQDVPEGVTGTEVQIRVPGLTGWRTELGVDQPWASGWVIMSTGPADDRVRVSEQHVYEVRTRWKAGKRFTRFSPVATAIWPGGRPEKAGCSIQRTCTRAGFQNLDNRSNVVLENMIISNEYGACLSAVNARNIVIRNVTFEKCGTRRSVRAGYDTGLILISNSSNVTVENSRFQTMSDGRFAADRNNTLQIVNSPNTTIINNEFLDIRSVPVVAGNNDLGSRAIMVRDPGSSGRSNNLMISGNRFFDAGRNAIQLSGVRAVSGVRIENNRIEGRGPWDSDYEDMISLYASSGTEANNIVIRGNYLRNGGPSRTGTGIAVGDEDSSYTTVEDNVLVDPGHVGIAIVGGHRNTVRDNIIYGDHDVTHATTSGMLIKFFPGQYAETCTAISVTGNRVFMRNQHLWHGVNHVYNAQNCPGLVIGGNIFGDEELSADVWDIDMVD